MEYHGRARTFADMIEFDLVQMVEMVDRMDRRPGRAHSSFALPETQPARSPVATSAPVVTAAPPAESEARPEPAEPGTLKTEEKAPDL